MTEARFGRGVHATNIVDHELEKRLWKHTVSPDQAKIIAACEDIIQHFVDEHFVYIFEEVHTGFPRYWDGWKLTVLDNRTYQSCWKYYPGIPGSTAEVLDAAFTQYKQLTNKVDADV